MISLFMLVMACVVIACFIVVADVARIHKFAFMSIMENRELFSIFTTVYFFPIVMNFVPWFPGWFNLVIWYTFLIHSLVLNAKSSNVTVILSLLPVCALFESILSVHSIIMLMNGGQLLTLGFMLASRQLSNLQALARASSCTETSQHGSKHVDRRLQCPHTSSDMSCPANRSPTGDEFLSMLYCQYRAAFASSDSPSMSSSSYHFGFCLTRLRSSCKPSSKNLSSSCESCWANPANVSLSLPICFLSELGTWTEFGWLPQTLRIRLANSVASTPLEPTTDVLLRSESSIRRNTELSSKVWLRHWMHAFM